MKTKNHPLNKPNLIFGIILIAYLVYASIYIFKTSFIIAGERYFVLFDEAMISMQFAKNFANGFGLVWSRGEFVEGFSNPLWVFLLSLFHLLPIPLSKMGLVVQISGAVFLVATLFFVNKISRLISDTPYTGVIAVSLTAFYIQLSTWSLLGMEVSLAALLTTMAVFMAIKTIRTNGGFSPSIYILLGFSTLLRIDLAITFLGIWAYLILFDKENRNKHILWGALSLIIFLGSQTAARKLYYNEWLPNTFYLKIGGGSTFIKLKTGLYYLLRFIWRWNPAFFWLPFIFTAIRLLEERRNNKNNIQALNAISPFLLILFLLALYCLYSIYVGGDAWEKHGGANRFISTSLPLYFALTASALTWIIQKVRLYFSDQHNNPYINTLAIIGITTFSIVGIIDLRFVADPDQIGHWLIANTVSLAIILIMSVSLVVQERKRIFYIFSGYVVGLIYLIIEALIRRYNAAGDLIGLGGFINATKVIAKVFFSVKAPLLWMTVFFILFIHFNKGKKWWFTAFIFYILGFTINILYGSIFTSIQGGASNLFSSYLPAGVILLMYTPGLLHLTRSNINTAFKLAGFFVILIAYLVNINALRDMSSLNVWLLKERHIFIAGTERMVNISVVLNTIAEKDAKVAVVTAGIIPYFTDTLYIDQLGKCDPVIARMDLAVDSDLPPDEYRSGHMKWDPTYSLGILQPDIVAQLFNGYNNPDNLRHLENYTAVSINGLPFYLKNDSSHIRWNFIPAGVPAWTEKP